MHTVCLLKLHANPGNASGVKSLVGTYQLIPSVGSKVVFPKERDVGISFCRLLLHDTMLNDDSFRCGTSVSPACDCGSDRETAEHFLFLLQ